MVIHNSEQIRNRTFQSNDKKKMRTRNISTKMLPSSVERYVVPILNIEAAKHVVFSLEFELDQNAVLLFRGDLDCDANAVT